MALAAPLWLQRLWKRDAVACVCVAVGIVHLGFVLWPDPILVIEPDSIGYLQPVVDFFERGEFTHVGGRGFVYPLFLLMVLGISPEPAAIVLAQRTVAVATYAAVAASVWIVADSVRRQPHASHRSPPWVAAVWLLVAATHAPSIQYAQFVMAEVLFSLIVSLIVLCVVLVALRGALMDWKSLALTVALAEGLAVMALFVKPHWIAAPLLLAPVLMLATPRGRRVASAAAMSIGVVAALLLFALPEKLLQERYDAYASRVFGPRSLFCNSADLMREHLLRSSSAFDLEVAARLGPVVDDDARAIERARGWRKLGFNGDKCTYGHATKLIEARFGGDAGLEVAYYLSTYLAALRDSPGYLVRRLASQIGWLVLRPLGDRAAPRKASAWQVEEQAEAGSRFYRRWLQENPTAFAGDVSFPFAQARMAQSVLHAIALPGLLWAGVLLGLWRLWRRPPSADRDALLRAALALLVLCFGTNMAIAVIHTFDIGRYATMQAPLFIVMGSLLARFAFARNNSAYGSAT
jgi:hypothetical protein